MTSLAKDSFSGILGNGAAQAVSIVTVPIVTRLYPPDAYGVLATFLSLLALFMPIAALRLNSAIVLPKLVGHAWHLRNAAYVAAILLALAIALVMLAFRLSELEMPEGIRGLWTSGLAYLLPVAVLIMGWQQVEIGWLSRTREFRWIAWSRLLETTSERLLAIIAALAIGPFAIVLIGSRVVGLASSWALMRRAPVGGHMPAKRGSKLPLKMLSAVSRRSSFPLQFTWGYLAEAVGRNAPIIIMAAFYEPRAIGIYALALTVANLPLVLLGDPLGQVFLQAAGFNRQDRHVVRSVARRMVTAIICSYLPLVLILLASGTELCAAVFGPGWAEAGKTAAVVAAAGPIALAHRVLGSLYEVYESPRIRILSDVIAAVAKVLLVGVAASMGSDIFVLVAALALVGALGYGVALELVLRRELGEGLVGMVEWTKLWPAAPLCVAALVVTIASLGILATSMVWGLALALYVYLLSSTVAGLLSTFPGKA